MTTLTPVRPPTLAAAPRGVAGRVKRPSGLAITVAATAALWAGLFAWLSVVRYLAGGTHAEDLGFTDQVIWNFTRGQWFRMSLYRGATWDTEIDVARIARPDSLLAFHVEPMLLLFVPLYALGASAVLLLVVQAAGVALGAIPAYRLGRHWGQASVAGFAVALTYLLSPLGQWAVLSDFHTATLATPLLLLVLERLYVARAPRQALLVAALALAAREDVGPVVAGMGLLGVLRPPSSRLRRFGLVLLAAGIGWTVASGLILSAYSGGSAALGVRYEPTLASLPGSVWQAVARPSVRDYLVSLLAGGGGLALLGPSFLLPALPSLALNVLSSSPWMASGKAHYSALVLPFVIAAAATSFRRLRRVGPRAVNAAAFSMIVVAFLGYLAAGAGPLAENYTPATVEDHARKAEALAETIPAAAAVSASASLVPWLDRRPSVYVFPAIEHADVVFVDVARSPAPTSAGDVYLRVRDLLSGGGWDVTRAEDGLLLLTRSEGASPVDPRDLPDSFLSFARGEAAPHQAMASLLGGDLDLLEAGFVPGADAPLEPDGPRWTLRTSWRANRPLPSGRRPVALFDLSSGEQLRIWDVAALWWYPPDRWQPGEIVRVDVPNVPIRRVAGWHVDVQLDVQSDPS